MVKYNQCPSQGQKSVKFRAKPLEGPSFEIADFTDESDISFLIDENKRARRKPTSQPAEVLSTAELISAVGHIWDCTSRSLARFQPKASIDRSYTATQKDKDSCFLVGSKHLGALNLVDSRFLHSYSYYPHVVQRSLECMRVIRNVPYVPCDDHFIQTLFTKNRQDSSNKHSMCLKEKKPTNVGIPYELMDRYEWMRHISPWPELLISTSMESKKIIDPSISEAPGCTHEPSRHKVEDDDLLEKKMMQCVKLNTKVELQSETCSSVTNKAHPFVAKQEHAVSGALAGIVVSLCLHPIDTIKTVVQSCRVGHTSVFHIGQTIVSERGLTGLYRGITSNITTSAPISAIYTFTYESVKGFLLPSLSKEYHSVAHCTAGACASIATSFIFTPSERIKQQMQVNPQYRNCWNAVFRIISNGGLPSLYTGWGAVLCRNIPHSIIKFYTYESLKQMFMSSPADKQPNTLQTLFCGGLAGSAAALFSTPFDVVKTRLQTQMPGTMRRYDSIRKALQIIHQHEGFRGLYRGLLPRLVMYMSQGALFFASYECFKSVFSLELRQHETDMLQHKQDPDDDPLYCRYDHCKSVGR